MCSPALKISLVSQQYNFFFKKRFYLFSKRGEERERRRERNTNVWVKHWLVASCTPPPWDQAHNLGMCPLWGSNWWPFTLQDHTQPTEPYHPTYLFGGFQITFGIFERACGAFPGWAPAHLSRCTFADSHQVPFSSISLQSDHATYITAVIRMCHVVHTIVYTVTFA